MDGSKDYVRLAVGRTPICGQRVSSRWPELVRYKIAGSVSTAFQMAHQMGVSDIRETLRITYLPAAVEGAFVQTLDRRTIIEVTVNGLVEPMAVNMAKAPNTERAKARIPAKLWIGGHGEGYELVRE